MPITLGNNPREVGERMLREVGAAVGTSNLSGASAIADEALRRGMVHPIFLNARALWSQQRGLHKEALSDFERARELTPRDPVLLNAIGLCLTRLNRAAEGIAVFDQALQVTPNSAQTYYRRGWAHAAAGDTASANRDYERAIALQPDHAEALAALATAAARAGNEQAARDYAARALAINPNEPAAHMALAMLDNARGDFAAAEAELRPLLDDKSVQGHHRFVTLGYLADALDGQDKVADAFAAYTEKNEGFRAIAQQSLAGRLGIAKFIDTLSDYFEAAPREPWLPRHIETPSADAPAQHVFLLGFMRSGTTLLEQVLATHPAIEGLEERETFSDTAPRFLADRDGLDRLAALSGDALEDARASYWKKVREFGADPASKILLDKQPLNTFYLPLIYRLFPDAKIIFALRDPRDVVLSCFRRHFDVNPTIYELLRLTDGARFYSSVMQLAQSCREKLPLNLVEHRYEDMVQDFERTVRAVCDFIGLEWTDTMRDFAQNARGREIRSPSANQVRRGLYGEGIGQWRRYASEFAPALPILAPWVARFGYEAD